MQVLKLHEGKATYTYSNIAITIREVWDTLI